jgi:hypothetical protein
MCPGGAVIGGAPSEGRPIVDVDGASMMGLEYPHRASSKEDQMDRMRYLLCCLFLGVGLGLALGGCDDECDDDEDCDECEYCGTRGLGNRKVCKSMPICIED